jgi:hypothetical protein
MNASRRLLGALACAAALLVPAAAAHAAAPGINVTDVALDGTPHGGWQVLSDSGAKTVRTFVAWDRLRDYGADEVLRYSHFVDGANSRGMDALLVVTGGAGSMAAPDAYASAVGRLATGLRGKRVAYEVWNEEDETTFWANGPQPAAYAALLRAAYPAVKAADPAATVVVGGLVGNDFDFMEQLYANGAKGSFDAVGVHTDTACLTTDPREYYREPSGRIGRYSFTGYREVHATMVAHGDDKPIWMTELGWSTWPELCTVGARAGTKPGGVSPAQQADFLSKAYGCLANDPYVTQAAWFNLYDLNPHGDLGLLDSGLSPKPAFAAFKQAGSASAIPCGGTLDGGAPQVTILAPTENKKFLTSLPISVRATDSEGVRDIDIIVDGKQVPLRTNKDGKDAFIKYEWGGAKNLSYGPHTLEAVAHDEAKNAGRATVHVLHVGGGAYPFSVPTRYSLSVGKVKRGKIKVRGKVAALGGYSRLAHGRAYVYFSRFDTKNKRWKTVSRFSRDAKHAFTLRYVFKKRGVWRVTGAFKPKKGFKKAKTKARKLKV